MILLQERLSVLRSVTLLVFVSLLEEGTAFVGRHVSYRHHHHHHHYHAPQFTQPSSPPSSFSSSSSSSSYRSSLDMFTGIVEEMGTVIDLIERDDMTLWDGTKGRGTELTVGGKIVLDGAYLGCSICVSGVCLTATHLDIPKGQFTVGLAPETLRRTYFRSLRPGDAVNLERASEMGGRNSGHFVQGHVDCTGTIIQRYPEDDSIVYKIQVPSEQMTYIVPKGFIAIDGTSLTVVEVNPEESWFTFMLVDYTQTKIIVTNKDVGQKVNIEVDVVGKYTQTTMATFLPRVQELEEKVHMLEQQVLSLQQQQQQQ